MKPLFIDIECVTRDDAKERLVSKVTVPGNTTTPDILKEANAEVKRVMLQCAGWERILLESNAKELDSYEGKSGPVTLFSLNIGDADARLLSMFNDTKEPDGTHKPYVLRVPPNVQNAKEAMAWTWEMTEGEYSPVVES